MAAANDDFKRYEFTPMAVTDLPLIKRWLETPHVSEWWVNPVEQFELVSGDLDHPEMAQFIGEQDMLGAGHVSAFIREFAGQLLANGIPRVVLDPDPANLRAIRAYEKAGFQRDRMVDTPNGPALLMVRNA